MAASRTARVPGRIKFLVVSIRTIKGTRAPGVPAGTRWANISCVWFNHPYNRKDNHKGRAKASVIAIWLVLVNT